MRLAGKQAVITGGSNGIGRALALGFAREGADVVVADLRPEPLPDGFSDLPTADLVAAQGVEGHFHRTDIASSSSVTQLFDAVCTRHGRIDVVVNNAALLESAAILETSDADFDRVMAVNLRGQFLVAKRAIELMMAQEPVSDVRGRLINVSSTYGLVGAPAFFAYSVAKGGLVNMTRQLAVDYGRHGVLVNGLAPGRIVTRPDDRSEDPSFVNTDIARERARTPFHRFGRPADLVGPAVFLASDECSYVSGHTLVVDGGYTAS